MPFFKKKLYSVRFLALSFPHSCISSHPQETPPPHKVREDVGLAREHAVRQGSRTCGQFAPVPWEPGMFRRPTTPPNCRGSEPAPALITPRSPGFPAHGTPGTPPSETAGRCGLSALPGAFASEGNSLASEQDPEPGASELPTDPSPPPARPHPPPARPSRLVSLVQRRLSRKPSTTASLRTNEHIRGCVSCLRSLVAARPGLP